MKCKSDCVFNIDGKCTRQSKKDITVTEKWKNDFKGFISRLSMPEDDFYGIMQYIDEVPNEERWIPVSERLPEDEQEILFSTKTGRVHSGKYHDDDSANRWYSHRDKCRAWNNVVSAWMPLPEPYKGE